MRRFSRSYIFARSANLLSGLGNVSDYNVRRAVTIPKYVRFIAHLSYLRYLYAARSAFV